MAASVVGAAASVVGAGTSTGASVVSAGAGADVVMSTATGVGSGAFCMTTAAAGLVGTAA